MKKGILSKLIAPFFLTPPHHHADSATRLYDATGFFLGPDAKKSLSRRVMDIQGTEKHANYK
jgi:hypothetical protein